MPRIIEYTENEGSAQTSVSTLMQLINQSKSATAGMAGFQIKALVVSSISAAIFGEMSFMLLSNIFGPGMRFIVGAGTGFLGGLVHRWRTDVREAKQAFCEFPALMGYHLRMVDPSLRLVQLNEWRRRMESDQVQQGFAIAALYSAAPSLARIKEAQEEEIVNLEAARVTTEAAAKQIAFEEE